MSEDKMYRGKLKELYRSSKVTLEEQCRRLFEEKHNLEKDHYYVNYIQALTGELGDKYIIVNERVFEVIELEEISPYDNFISLKDMGFMEELKFSFITKYHNGSTYLGEMLTEGLEKALKDE